MTRPIDRVSPEVTAPERLPLSVCCLTHVGPAQTRAALSGLSDIAAEVVLGVDARCASQAAAYEAFADRVIVFPAAIVEHRLAALHAACSQPWTLRIDSDEVASPGLLEALPGLLADDRIAQYWIARRWLVQGGEGWLDEAPWWPDYQVRLVRTAAATFSGDLHSSADAVTPRGLVLEPLYHADCVLTSLAERQQKVLRYAVSGGSPFLNDMPGRMYEPERFARREPVEVPGSDASVISNLLARRKPDGRRTPRGRVPYKSNAAEPVPGGNVELVERDPRFVTEGDRTVSVRVSNGTRDHWGSESNHVAVRSSWHWADGTTEMGPSTDFSVDLAPGQVGVVAVGVVTPRRLGAARLRIATVHERRGVLPGGAWLPAVVEPEPPAATRRPSVASRQSRLLTRVGLPRLQRGIPKVLHRVWLGTGEMPDAHIAYGESWKRLHPGWEMKLWTDADAPAPPGVERARNLAERADLVRYEIIRRFGGVYVDTDVECLRPIGDLLAGVRAFAAYEVPGRLCNAVIGAVPGHSSFTRAVELAGITVGRGIYPNATATSFLTYVLEADPDVTLFGPERFYPFLWDDSTNPSPAEDPPHAVHHWAKSWLAAKPE